MKGISTCETNDVKSQKETGVANAPPALNNKKAAWENPARLGKETEATQRFENWKRLRAPG